MFYLDPPIRLSTQPYSTIPEKWSTSRPNEWADNILGGKVIGSFLEGPCFDREGNLYVVDIPFGRIFRISPNKEWLLLAEYDGWPNGLKCTPEGRILVADHRQGLVEISDTGKAVVLVSGYRGERFRGLNDLTLGLDGWVYFTDQGQSGLQEQSGCVYRWHQKSGALERVLSNIPSPNGLVLSADGKSLYVAVTRTNTIWRAPFVLDGGVSKVGVHLNLSGGGGPDGIAVDLEGGLIVAQPGLGVLRFDPSGILTHFVQLPRGSSPSNITFESHDTSRMVITDSASGTIFTVDMPFAGYGMQETR
ncbi:putative lactonase drp35 [Hypoxylon rubiginosum]|uniref:Lactonase drp35 n=1 Tax=Hypoxylon rubiginosum TaxID=110542 RepID=A0ACC0CMR4_9PEZI|nr:putative lactonase drp35 [Hypoxylon rubiginosum]